MNTFYTIPEGVPAVEVDVVIPAYDSGAQVVFVRDREARRACASLSNGVYNTPNGVLNYALHRRRY